MKSLTSPRPSARARVPGFRPRRGLALLFVVSLILFITLLGASFVAVSQQFSASAKARARVDARGDSSRSLVYRAFYDLVRGPDSDNIESPLLGHSLLADMYGYGFSAIVADVSDASAATGIPGAVEFILNDPANPLPRGLGPGGAAIDFTTDKRFRPASLLNGHVLTFVDGPLRGTSVRVIGYSGSDMGLVTGSPFSFLVYPSQTLGSVMNLTDLNDARVVVNGRAFFGWGAGGPNAGGGANALSADALRPHLAKSTVAPVDYVSTGVNESYDAPDYQNMFLAALDNMGLIASFDREQLFTSQGMDPATNFRAFGNPGEPLHVDNDGDGTEDSIWMDPRYPVQTDIDGRRYKSLVAYLVLDMDGRLNVNAHGNVHQLDVIDTAGNPGADGLPDVLATSTFLLGNVESIPPGFMQMDGYAGPPRGQYLGPPEVSLAPVFGTGATYGQILISRYGEDSTPGIENIRDPWSAVRLYGYPDGSAAFNNNFIGGYFGSAMDVSGRYGVGIPNVPNGNVPEFRPALDANTTLTGLGQNELTDSPYEFTLIPQSRYPSGGLTSDDQPYTPKELERILRRFDRDSKMLPGRLWDLIPPADVDSVADVITSDSWEVPLVPGLDPDLALIDPLDGMPLELAGQPVSIPQRLYNLLIVNGVPPANANAAMADLVALDVRMGLPFDINRPFGNAADDNGNGTYDESSATAALSGDATINETNGTETVATVNGVRSLDNNGDGLVDTNEYLGRYEFAKQLYVLALLATGDTGPAPPVPALMPYDLISDPNTLRRIALAQWVINVVDFRDTDAINTPFEFDFNPFNGWEPDGDPDTADPDAYTVWGVERPELLIFETMASHDRRTEDLPIGGGGDPDFDNQLVPRATTFVELYHPWNANPSNQLMPAELMDGGGNGIDLLRTTSAGDPVWRLVAVRGTATNENPERVVFEEDDIARRVYFVQPNIADVRNDNLGSGAAFAGQKVYFPGAGIAADGVITPGGFAVIGSAGVGTNAAAGQTFFGRRSDSMPFDPTSLPTTRNLVLDNAAREVSVYDPVADATATRSDVVAIPIDQHYDPISMAAAPRSLGLSDPDGGYPGATMVGPDGLEFVAVVDTPVDADPGIQSPENIAATQQDGNTETFSAYLLQRLANPLAPWDPVSNPYLTVDRKTVDLTAFNGVADDSASAGIVAGDTVFASAERGRIEDPLYGSPAPLPFKRQLWPIEEPTGNTSMLAALPDFATLAGADSHFHSFELRESFGFFNRAYTEQMDYQAGAATLPLGFAGLPLNNRPFSSQMDLLDVPYTDSLELLRSFSFDWGNFVTDPFDPRPGRALTSVIGNC